MHGPYVRVSDDLITNSSFSTKITVFIGNTSNNDNLTNTQPHRALPQRSHTVHHSEQGGVRSP